MLALRLLLLSLCCALGLAKPQAPSDWASAASSIAASIRQSLSAAASMAAMTSLSDVRLLSSTASPTTSNGYATAKTTVSPSASITPSPSMSSGYNTTGMLSGNATRTSLRFPMTATGNISTVSLVTSFIVQSTAGAAPRDNNVQYAALFGGGAAAAAVMNLLV